MAHGLPKLILGALTLAWLATGIAWLCTRADLARLRDDHALLRAEADQVAALKAEVEQLRRVRADAEELERLRRQTQEIHRLRAQYQEYLQLREQHAALQLERDQLRASNQQLASQQQALRSQFQSVVAAAGASRTNAPALPAPEAWLGISIQTLADSPLVRAQNPGVEAGVVVGAVIPGTPAETSGLLVGDIVTAIDGEPVTTAAQLRQAMATKQVGQRVVVDVYRGGLVHKVGVNAAPYPRN
jgi:C-terminal processing protease CtpA/Prc